MGRGNRAAPPSVSTLERMRMDSKMLFVLFLAGACVLAFVAAYVGILQ